MSLAENFKDPWFRCLPAYYRLIWLYIETLPVDNHGLVRINEMDIVENCGSTAFSMHYCLEHFGKDKLIQVKEGIFQRPDKSVQNQNQKFIKKLIENELERIYKSYPKKMGKAEGMKRLKSQINTEDGLRAFEKAVLNYRNYCDKYQTAKYIKHFSSFIGSAQYPNWVEWIDWKDDDSSSASFDDLLGKVFK